jgi:predicted RNase H-like HicB family nuclease
MKNRDHRERSGDDPSIGTLKSILGKAGYKTMKFAVVFEKADSNWAAYVPDLPGCITTGPTLQEMKRNIREAVSLHLEAMREVGEPIPQPTAEPVA